MPRGTMGDRLNHPPDESAYFLVLLTQVKGAIEIDISSLTIVGVARRRDTLWI